MARPGADPAAANAAITLRGLRVVALAVALTLLALVIDARSRPAPPEPVVLLPVPAPLPRPFVPKPAPPPAPAAESAAGGGGSSPAPDPGPSEPEPAPAAERGPPPVEPPPATGPAPSPRPAAAEPAPIDAPPTIASPGGPAATGPVSPPQPAPAPGIGTTVRDGVLAYQAGEFERALAVWRPLAEAGNARARFHLGAMLLEGRLGRPDPEAAYRWLALAAEAGQSEAARLRDQAALALPPERVAAIRAELGLPP